MRMGIEISNVRGWLSTGDNMVTVAKTTIDMYVKMMRFYLREEVLRKLAGNNIIYVLPDIIIMMQLQLNSCTELRIYN